MEHPRGTAARDPRPDVGLQEPALPVQAPHRVRGGGRLIEAERRPVGIADGAPDAADRYAAAARDLEALDELQRLQRIAQPHAVGQQGAVDLDAGEAAEAEQVRHALPHLAHRQRRADPRLDQLQRARVVQRRAAAVQLHRHHRPADELVDLRAERGGAERQRREEVGEERAAGGPRRSPAAPRTRGAAGPLPRAAAHQNAWRTRKSSA